MKKQLRKPENWQDFENLCKKLWGEIWQCPYDIKKHGRSGQKQNGVDIYAAPKGESDYYGIQCKLKSESLGSNITEDEIQKEIDAALQFKPKLVKLVIATTSPKDVKIEEFVRIKNLEYKERENLSIEIYCWEDIADLIEEHKNTYLWYLKEYNFKDKFSIKISFMNNEDELVLKPQFKKTIVKYQLRDHKPFDISPFVDLNKSHNFKLPELFGSVNKSWTNFQILILNNGTEVIEDYKLFFSVEGNFRALDDDRPSVFGIPVHLSELPISITENKIFYQPLNNEPLIQNDHRSFKIHLLSEMDKYEIPISWKLLARDYNTSGKLLLKIIPEFLEFEQTKIVESHEELMDDEITVEYLKEPG